MVEQGVNRESALCGWSKPRAFHSGDADYRWVMKFPALLLALGPLMFAGCSAVGKAVGAATHVLGTGVNAVTRPLSAIVPLADAGTENGWKESIRKLQEEDATVAP